VAILSREAECAVNMHNNGFYWAVWSVKARQWLSILSSGGHFVQRSGMWRWYAQQFTRVGTDHSSAVSFISFSIQSCGGQFVKQSRKCQRYAQLGLILITPEKYRWNPPSSLTCESRTSLIQTDGGTDRQQRQKQYVSQRFWDTLIASWSLSV
jgi:hypothetical protein